MAVDPSNPSIIVGGTNTNYSAPNGDLFAPGYFTSRNAGRSFTFGSMPMLRPYTTGADPSLAIAGSGTVFYSFLGETHAYCSGGRSAIMLTTSADGGQTFRTPTVVDSDPTDDKPSLVVQSVPGRKAHVFLTWTRWHNRGSDVWYSRSVDGGRTFSPPIALYSSNLDNFGPLPLVAPHGNVYVFWTSVPRSALSRVSPLELHMRRSSDGGARFGPARSVLGSFRSLPEIAQPNSMRNLPTLAATATRKGVVYLAWTAVARQRGAGGDADILVSRSGDKGASWSRPARVNDVRRGDRFMASLSAFADGSVGVAFYDRRDGLSELAVYATHVDFQGHLRATGNVRVSRVPSSVFDILYLKPGSTCFIPGRFFGDYIGTSATGKNVLCVTWADTQLRIANETDIWFARVKLPKLAPFRRRKARGRRTGSTVITRGAGGRGP